RAKFPLLMPTGPRRRPPHQQPMLRAQGRRCHLYGRSRRNRENPSKSMLYHAFSYLFRLFRAVGGATVQPYRATVRRRQLSEIGAKTDRSASKPCTKWPGMTKSLPKCKLSSELRLWRKQDQNRCRQSVERGPELITILATSPFAVKASVTRCGNANQDNRLDLLPFSAKIARERLSRESLPKSARNGHPGS